MKHKSKCAQSGSWTWWVHISYSTTIPYMRFQKKVRLTIPWTTLNTFRIISKIHSSILNSLETWSTVMSSIKHSIFPANSASITKWSWWFLCLKLISVMCIFQKEVEVSIHMHMNDNRCIVDDVMMQIL